MGKKNVILNYKKNPLSDGFFDALRAADENDLRLMLSLSLLSDGEKVDCAPLADKLGLSEGELDASIKYWCGAGVLKKSAAGRSAAKKGETDTKKADDSKSDTAHRDGKLERGSELPSYTSAELSELIEKRRVTAEFINEAQRIVGKVFNSHEVGILVGIVDYIGFDESSVIIILSHMVKSGKKTVRYAEKLAFSLYDMGITTPPQLLEYFRKLDEYKETEGAVRALFGMTGRALTSTESKYLDAWINKMGFDLDAIRIAYDITVDNTQKPVPSYANKILESWHANGLRTKDAILRFIEESKAEKGGNRQDDGGSFDTDDFFRKALERTFEEL